MKPKCLVCGALMEENTDPENGPRGWYCSDWECVERQHIASLNPEEREKYLAAVAEEQAAIDAMFSDVTE